MPITQVQQDPYFYESPRGHVYRRAIPRAMQPIVGHAIWWARLDRDKETARRQAAALTRQHDQLVQAFRSPAIRALGSPAAVAKAFRQFQVDQLITQTAALEPPGWRSKQRALGRPGEASLAYVDDVAERAYQEERRLAPVIAALAQRDKPVSPVLSAVLEQWLTAKKPAHNTYRKYNATIRALIAAVGDIEVRTLTGVQVQEYIDARNAAAAASTVSADLTIIKVMLGWALRRKPPLVTENVAAGIDPPTDTRPKENRHHPAMPWREVPAFVQTLSRSDSEASKALRMIILTASRVDMVLGMPWAEVDMDAKVWTVPPTRMKAKRSLRIPLPDECLSILAQQPRDRPRVFKSHRRTVAELLPGGATIHGFRSSFTDWVADTRPDDADAAEVQLAHAIGSKVTQAYRRSDLLERRRTLMEAWTAFVLPSASATEAPLAPRESPSIA